ncbi:hypothetical protein LZ480_15635 [Solibacillus sp. MA9]|uniref:Uncharacterized protein n=1 Tax=Solibacillus palustris TaxID=2908203 RepID=A0ABS9UG56_9BACL|nr:hypothetical protein [Solibacillus sp. MA9]MCH7323307.1 hypothetical protein [Solibacillus sp. MA9]
MMNQFGATLWFSVIPAIFYICCLYFTLSFFQHLKFGEETKIKKAKLGAVISLTLALLVPAIYQLIIFLFMMR